MLLASPAIAFRDASSRSNSPSSFGMSRNGCVWASARLIARGLRPMMVAEEAAATDRMKLRRDISLRILSSRLEGSQPEPTLDGHASALRRLPKPNCSKLKAHPRWISPAEKGGWLEGWPSPVRVRCASLRAANERLEARTRNTSRPDRPILLQCLNRFDNGFEKSSVYVSDDAAFHRPARTRSTSAR